MITVYTGQIQEMNVRNKSEKYFPGIKVRCPENKIYLVTPDHEQKKNCVAVLMILL